MKAYTDGKNVYTVDSLGKNCWKHIGIHHLEDWKKDNGEIGHCYWIMTSEHEISKLIGNTSWITNEDAENALSKCAEEQGWKEI